MPRHDQMPTNPELQADFRTASGEAFTSAVDRGLAGDKLPDALEGKPLSKLQLRVERRSKGNLAHESLDMSVMTPDDAAGRIEDDRPEHVKDFSIRLAHRLADVALDRTLDVRSVVPPSAFHAVYTSETAGGEVRVHMSDTPRPRKDQLVLAKTFAEGTALPYVNSDRFDMFQEAQMAGPDAMTQALRESGGSGVDEIVYHKFELPMTPDLPLNGHESKRWLQEYAAQMWKREIAADERLNKINSLPHQPPQAMIDDVMLQREEARAAKERALALLGR